MSIVKKNINIKNKKNDLKLNMKLKNDNKKKIIKKNENKKKEYQIKELKDQLLRIKAEFENYKKRSKKELEYMANYGIENLILSILPVLDNFDRAINLKLETNKEKNYENFCQGFILIKKQLMNTLKIYGLEKIESLGKIFDPIYHNGITKEIVKENDLNGKIIEEFQKGYILNKKVIRPSMVKIGIKKN